MSDGSGTTTDVPGAEDSAGQTLLGRSELSRDTVSESHAHRFRSGFPALRRVSEIQGTIDETDYSQLQRTW